MTVSPRSINGINMMWGISGRSMFKFAIVCGHCSHTFRQRIGPGPICTNTCPLCGAVNEFMAYSDG